KKQVMLTAPKNRKAREVDLSAATIKALRELKAVHGEEYQGAIFITKAGKRLHYDVISRHYRKIRPRPVGLHALRHTYATMRIAKGDNIVDVSNQLGHHDAGFTLRRYAHWLPRAHKAQVDELDYLHLTHPDRTQEEQTRMVMH
ncbi:MAG: tyrosine-type recombinase/integrase, partial [Deltaproteobacteria bacterium]|nr:tyrosine-type recombinase/integrase [Deltaproteobacteria bacterium]